MLKLLLDSQRLSNTFLIHYLLFFILNSLVLIRLQIINTKKVLKILWPCGLVRSILTSAPYKYNWLRDFVLSAYLSVFGQEIYPVPTLSPLSKILSSVLLWGCPPPLIEFSYSREMVASYIHRAPVHRLGNLVGLFVLWLPRLCYLTLTRNWKIS